MITGFLVLRSPRLPERRWTAMLDEQAITAVRQWRFEPGRLAGTPVDVMVTVVMDFSIQ